MHTLTYTHSHTHALTHSHVHTHSHTHSHTHMRSHTHTHTLTHTHSHAHTHTHTHSLTHSLTQCVGKYHDLWNCIKSKYVRPGGRSVSLRVDPLVVFVKRFCNDRRHHCQGGAVVLVGRDGRARAWVQCRGGRRGWLGREKEGGGGALPLTNCSTVVICRVSSDLTEKAMWSR